MVLRFLLGCVLAVTAAAQSASPQVELANLREDVRGLSQRLSEMSLRLEQVEKENADLRARVSAQRPGVTTSQLTDAVNELQRAMRAENADTKAAILQQVSGQLEKLAKQTNAALDALAKGQATRPTVQKTFTDDFPKEGATYTVQPGESLAAIAKKFSVKQQDIINANKLSDPSRLQAGQSLFIPGAK